MTHAVSARESIVSLIDTDVMIDLSRENAQAAGYLDALSDPAISIITARELIVGAKDKRDLHAIDSLVSAYRVIPIDAAIDQRAYALLKRYAKSGWLAHIRLSDRCHRDGTELHAREQEPETLRNDRRLAI
jgi:predicted nucleic acid-binding protein